MYQCEMKGILYILCQLMNSEEKSKQNFELKKILLTALLTFVLGLIGTGIWKFYDHYKSNETIREPEKTVLNSFVMTLNPSDGNLRKTFSMNIYQDMTGKMTYENREYSISDIVFQPNEKLVFRVRSFQYQDIELNGFYYPNENKYRGVIINLNNGGTTVPSLKDWEAVMK
jgi:hypothetical protein